MGGFIGTPPTIARGGFFGPPAAAPVSSVTFSIGAAPNSSSPYLCLPGPNSSFEFAAASGSADPCGNTAGVIVGDPVFVNGAQISIIGQISNGNDGRHYNTLCLVGNLPQNVFVQWSFDDGAGNHYDLTSASAGFNAPWDGTGSGFTIWAWIVPVGQEFAPLNQPMTITW
jgi:hypothetical protein